MRKSLCLALALLIIILTGCAVNSVSTNAQTGEAEYQSYKDIPGVTQNEIDAIEKLLEEKPELIYGVNVTTEAFLREDGSYGGFSALFTERMSQLFGFEFTVYPMVWNDLIEGIVSKEIDFTGEFTATPERLKIYHMTDPIVQRTIKIFTDSNSASLNDISKERPVKCAFLDGSTMLSVAKNSWTVSFEPVLIDDESLVPKMLQTDKIDAFIEEGIFEASFDSYDFIESEDYYPLTYSPVSLTTGNSQLEPIIAVMQKYLKNGGYYELTQLYNQGYTDYLKNKLFGQLTENEKNYIQKHLEGKTPIPVACEIENYPTGFYNTKEKEFQGMGIDTLEQISELTGLNFEVSNGPDTTWSDIIEGLENGKYSVCTELLRNSKREGRFIWADKPYCKNNYALISKAEYPDVDINQILFSKIGLIEGAGHTDIFLEWFPDSADTVAYYASLNDAFAALEKGDIDLMMANENMLLNFTNYQEKPGYKANVVFSYSSDSQFGFNKNEEILCSIVNKALNYAGTDEISASWQRKVFDYESKMLRDTMPYAVAVSLLLLAALIVVFILLMKNRKINKNLDQTVNLRTNEIKSQAALLERRLEQQRLMASLSQNFITGGDMDEKITDSLRMTGEFLDVSRVLLLKYEDQSFHYMYEWNNPSRDFKSKVGTIVPVSPADKSLISAYSQRTMSYFSLDDTDRKDFIQRYQLEDIVNLLMFPIYVEEEFWGVLEFDRCENNLPWSSSNIDLGEMVAGILSGVMARRKMENDLIHLSSIVENSPQFITTVRGGGEFVYFNHAAVEVCGYSREELKRGGLSLLLSPENYRYLRETLVPIIVKNKKHTYELSFITKSGETRIMSVSAFIHKTDENVICSIASDVTDLTLMQRELEDQTSKLALQTTMLTTMFEAIPDLVFCKDLNLCFTRYNKSFMRHFGISKDSIIGLNDVDGLGIPEDMAEQYNEFDRKIINEQKPIVVEETIPSVNGTSPFFETAKVPLIQDGNVVGIMGISRDITERKAAEETFKLTLDNLDTCVYITEIETGKILFINKKMEEEYSDSDCVGKFCWEVLQNNQDERCDFCPVPKLLESGDKNYIWEEYSSITGKTYRNTDSLIRWHDGRLVHMQNSVDITDINKAQTALSKRLRQQSLMTSMSQSFLSDTDFDTLVSNALRMVGEFMEIAQILCYKFEDDGVTLTCQSEWMDPKLNLDTRIGGKLQVEGPMTAVIEKMTYDREYYLSSNDPSLKETMAPYRINFENHITTALHLKDKMYGVLDFSKANNDELWSESDIDLAILVSSLFSGFFERHSIEDELINAKELAEQGSRSKSDFLSRMSHEIRTPLNAVIGMVNIAMDTEDNRKIHDCLTKADSASKHLLGVINDILDMSKIEAEKFELDSREFNFEKMLMNVTNVTNFRTDEKNQSFIVNLNGNVPDSIICDDLRLSQVITNLLTNAVKFTPEYGTIILDIDKIEDSGDTVTLKVAIKDNGIGISKEQQQRLFTSFEQADGGIARKFGGTGLGLAISKRIINLMGGKIWVESELGEGSKFIFTINVGKGKDKGDVHTVLSEKINKNDMRIMAVDGNNEIREYFTRIMNSLDLPCDVAADGKEALDMVKKSGERPYNIFFVDWQIPDMNGIELTEKIKALAPDNSVVFIISVSDWNTIEKEALAAGARSFISKPLFPSTLVNAINECMEIETGQPQLDSEVSDEKKHIDFTNHAILIAEDIEINREIMSAVLESSGINIDYAQSGSMAVSMFKKNPDKYSLILMDIHMPEMDGYEATRRIRALKSQKAKTIPIIAMTANVFREDIENCLAAGMNDHIGKPIDTDNLFEIFNKYLS